MGHFKDFLSMALTATEETSSGNTASSDMLPLLRSYVISLHVPRLKSLLALEWGPDVIPKWLFPKIMGPILVPGLVVAGLRHLGRRSGGAALPASLWTERSMILFFYYTIPYHTVLYETIRH